MKFENDPSPLSEWIPEIGDALLKSKSFYVALISTEKKLIYSNDAFNSLVKDDPCNSFLNPSFDDILAMDASSGLVFNGYLTFGDYQSDPMTLCSGMYANRWWIV